MRNKEILSVFISYSHADKRIARVIAQGLKRAGLRVWIDEGELRAGDSIIKRISDAISEFEFVVALISKNSTTSNWCSKELSLVLKRGVDQGNVRVLPLKIDDVEMPSSLTDVLYLQFTSRNTVTILKRLIADARAHRLDLETRLSPGLKIKVKPLPLKSSIKPRKLKQLQSALQSRDLWIANNALDILMKDYSVPAVEALYTDALKDSLENLNHGFGIAGLVYLAPVTTPWLYKLLIHEDDRVVKTALDVIEDYCNDVTISDIFEDIRSIRNWSLFKSRVHCVVKDRTSSLYRLRGFITTIENHNKNSRLRS